MSEKLQEAFLASGIEHALSARDNGDVDEEVIKNEIAILFKDPDSWGRIPEFKVWPGAIKLEGFGAPIFGIDKKSAAEAEMLRRMLRTARTKVRSIFQKKHDLLAAAVGFTGADDEEPSYIHMIAFAYLKFEQHICRAVAYDVPTEERFLSLAFAGGALGMLFMDATDLLQEYADLKDAPSKGGRKSAETRQQKAVSKDAIIAAAVGLGYPEKRFNVNQIIARQFGLTPDYVGTILRAEFKKSSGAK